MSEGKFRMFLRLGRAQAVAILLALGVSLSAASQEIEYKPGQSQGAGPIQPHLKSTDASYVQELDSNSAALAKIPSHPLIRPDPLRFVLDPIDNVAKKFSPSERLVFGATYTFLNQYATIAPDGVRHNQTGGRLDFSGSFVAYDHGNTAGSFSLLIRSGSNIGYSQQFNLSDQLGSGVFLNCLQGGGAQRPITINVLYYRQDFLAKRLSLYVGKIHPNQFISLSMYNNDERTQFLNGENDGNLAIASDGTYAGGGAVEYQITHHLYIHALGVDTKGSQQTNLKTMGDGKYLEAAEMGWFSGFPGTKYTNFRAVLWRDDTANLGSGYGGGFAFEHEAANGWTPFARFGVASETGTTIKQTDTLGVAQTHPFGRRGDMFGASFSYTEPTHTGKHHESIFESFYRLRLSHSINIGPDLQVSIHPTYAVKAYTTTLLNARMEIIF